MTARKVEQVLVSQLKIDPAYQRDRKEKLISNMGSAWDDELAETITVSDRTGTRNGQMYVLEGQQRVHGARAAHEEKLWAVVLDGLSPSDEARIFHRINESRIAPTYNEKFKARLYEGESSAVLTRKVAQDAGLSIDLNRRSGHQRDANTLVAVAALEKFCRRDESLGRQTLTVLKSAWDEPGRLQNGLIHAVGGFLWTYRDHPYFQQERLIHSLATVSPARLLRLIKDLNEALTAGTHNAMSRPSDRAAILGLYNKGLRLRLPEATQSDFKRIGLGQNPWAGA